MDSSIVTHNTFVEKLKTIKFIIFYLRSFLYVILAKYKITIFNRDNPGIKLINYLNELKISVKSLDMNYNRFYQTFTQKEYEANLDRSGMKKALISYYKELIETYEKSKKWKIFNEEIHQNTPPEIVDKIRTKFPDNYFINVYGTPDKIINKHMEEFQEFRFLPAKIIQSNVESVCDFCDSGNVVINKEMSNMVCQNCLKITNLYAIVYEEEQLYGESVGYTKQKNHNELIHAKKWLSYILGEIDIDIPEAHFRQIFEAVSENYRKYGNSNEYINFDNMSCEYIRRCLKKIKLTEYNKYVVYLRKKITELMGKPINPALFTTDEIDRLMKEFENIIVALRQIPNGNKNIHYPFYWDKVFRHRLKKGERADKILECIHHQGKETTAKNEKIWNTLIENKLLKNFIY